MGDGDPHHHELYDAIMRKKWNDVETMFQKHPEIHGVKITNSDDTALHVTINLGAPERTVLKLLDEIKQEEALEAENKREDTPLHCAASRGSHVICARIVRVASSLDCRDGDATTTLMGKRNENGETPLFVNEEGKIALEILASIPSAFKTGTHLRFFHKLCYSNSHVIDLEDSGTFSEADTPSLHLHNTRGRDGGKARLEKENKNNNIGKSGSNNNNNKRWTALLIATKYGVIEVVKKMQSSRNTCLGTSLDRPCKCNGKSSGSSTWKENMPTYMSSQTNKEGNTPGDIFTTEHMKLAEKSNTWLDSTVAAYSFIAAITATLTFAASIQVPGGNNDTDGKPVLQGQPIFTTFNVATLVAFCLSIVSLASFLTISC
ncbi:Ankyrin repeat-containing protein [Senna tora]|uniref:Ankyrin repeat-containing protein n=1 Tax=Senna tora TaxID=362788 RepID=A0A835CJW5_9FABA|nr:Ankyrin repeat-containing protein [Senna tora]